MLINFAIGVVTGHRPGVPVRHELVGVLALRRRHLRRAAGDGGPGGVLPRVDVPRPVDLRLGPARARACTWPRSTPSPSARRCRRYFILAANSWMQHPVGYTIDHATGHAEMTSIIEVLTNSTLLYALPAHDRRRRHDRRDARRRRVGVAPRAAATTPTMFGRAIRHRAAGGARRGASAPPLVGHGQAQLMTKQQPMKMAAAEALYETRSGAPFSLFAVAPFEAHPSALDVRRRRPERACRCWRPTRSNGRVEGDQRRSTPPYQAKYGPGDYRPVIGVTYWAFRIMTGIGFVHDPARRLGLRAALARQARDARAGSCGWRPGRSRCRSSPTRPAGSSPRWGASPGSSRGCC